MCYPVDQWFKSNLSDECAVLQLLLMDNNGKLFKDKLREAKPGVTLWQTALPGTLRATILNCKLCVKLSKYDMEFRLVNFILLCSVNGLFTFAGIFLNSVVIICLWKSAKLRKGTCNFMILVLSSFDLLAIVVGHPAVILTAVPWSTRDNSSAHWSTRSQSDGYSLTEVAILASHYTQAFSLSTLLAMTLDRYLAITRPFFHKIHVTKRRLLALSIMMQLLYIVALTFRFFKGFRAIYYGGASLTMGTEMILLFVMNCRVFRIATKAKRNEQVSRMQLAVLKKGCTCLLAVVCFFVCLTPLTVYVVLRATSTDQLSEDSLMLLRLWGSTSMGMNSTWNCVIFFWRNETLRNTGKKLLSGCLKPRR